jgi:hypothetical protein
MDWTHLARYKVQRRDLANMVTNLGVPQKSESFFTAELPLAIKNDSLTLTSIWDVVNTVYK